MTPETTDHNKAPVTLYVNGCSMTYGYELIDDPLTHECLDNDYRQAHAWPGRLAHYMTCETVHNDSLPGASNERILRTSLDGLIKNVLQTTEPPSNLLVVIGWSGGSRREFHIGGQWEQMIPHHNYADKPALDNLTSAYRNAASNDYESAVRYINDVLYLQSFLQNYKINYLFFDALESLPSQLAVARADLAGYAALIDEKRYLNIGQVDDSMAAVLARETPNWKGRHPAEDGHDLWAGILARYLKEQNLLPADLFLTEPRSWTEKIRHKLKRHTPDAKTDYIYP